MIIQIFIPFSTFSSYLKHQILPIAKFSFYTGNVTFSVAQNLFNLFDRCKELLDTNGDGWSDAISDFSKFTIKIEPITIENTRDDESMKACGNLAMNQNDDDNEEDMLVAMPKMELEENEELSTIWLPLKRKHIFNIKSRTSTFILFRYYVMVTQCYSYQGINQGIFNRKLKLWIVDNILPYLDDDELYPAFGAVLRILETIKGPNDSGYQGTKVRKSKYQKALTAIQSLVEDDGVFAVEADNEIEWWFRLGMIGCAGIAIALILLFLILKLCTNRKKVEDIRDPPEAPAAKKPRNFVQKLANCFGLHLNESDEFYQYKKVSTNYRGVAFENEKRLRKKKSKDQINLPRIGNVSDSEEEVFSKKNLANLPRKQSNSNFKISESDDENESKKKPSKPPRKLDPQGILKCLRSKSPMRSKKSPYLNSTDER